MNVNSIYLDPKSLEETGGYYGIVANQFSSAGALQRFTEQYISKQMLVDEIQKLLNQQAQVLCELPEDGDRSASTAAWQQMKYILDEVTGL